MWRIQEPWEWFEDHERWELAKERQIEREERNEDDYPERWELEE